MSIPKNSLIILASFAAGVAATVAANYFTAGTLALPTKGGNTALPIENCRMQSPTAMPRGMGMMQSMQVASEVDYLSKMIPHHEEAIATAKLLKAGTNRPEMKKFADDIIRTQTAEIEQMRTGLNQWYPSQKAEVTYTPMMRDLTNLKGDELDRAFLEDMQMHHRGAIMMSHQLLMRNLVQHDQVKTLAENISTTQSNEIHQMQAWLQSWFGVTGTMGNGMGNGMGNHHGMR